MKKCNACGTQVEEQSNFCPYCGSSELIELETTSGLQNEQIPTREPQTESITDNGNGNIVAGIVGAFLFSILGGIIYFIIYQIGVIAGITGLITFVLANFGYGLFAKTKNKTSVVGLIVSSAATLIMIFLAEYFCISFEIYQIFKESGITIFDAIRVTPEFLADPEILPAVLKDLAFAYIFGIVAAASEIINLFKAKKKQ